MDSPYAALRVLTGLAFFWFSVAGPGVAPLVAQGRSPTVVTEDPEVEAAKRLFTAWLEGQMESRELPGVAVGVVADQELVWAEGFGYADLDARVPVTPATRFRIASHSKLFTATAIVQLRDEGRLRLEDPVSRHLPWFRVRPASADDPEITIEELLTHSSGLPREADAHWTTFEFPTQEDLLELIPRRHAAFPPETRWKYSNLAYTVAGMVVEAASGMPWAQYVEARILEPLGMAASSVDRQDPGLAVGYGRRMPDGTRDRMPFVDSRGMAAATGMTSTVEDMARFVSAQFAKGPADGDVGQGNGSANPRILGDASLRQMHRVRRLENDWSRGSGIGFAVSRERGRVLVGHGGGYPGYTTYTVFNPERRVGVIVFTNAQDSGPAAIATQLLGSVGEAVARAIREDPDRVAWDPAWSRFAGLYRGRGGDQRVVELHERLVILNPHAPSLENLIELEPLGEGRFRYEAPSGGGPVGEEVRFVEEDGRVLRMITGDSYVERIRD
jgi:D-alanyl-D-alanine carboxypeptidase